MTNKMTIAVVLSILLAVGAPLVSAISMAKKFQDYPSIRVDIEPYDPRDLFYGHYMQFQIKWNFKNTKPEEVQTSYQEKKSCLCVESGAVNPPVSVTQCAPNNEKPGCVYNLTGKSWNHDHFDNGVHRYYVDENIAMPLEDLFVKEGRRFSLDLHITPDGESLPGILYIDDLPLKDFIAKNGGKIPEVKTETLTP